MDKSQIQQLILLNTNVKEAIKSEQLWIKCGRSRKNDFYKILHDSIQENWIKRTKEGIIRVEFSKSWKKGRLVTSFDLFLNSRH